MVVSSRVKYTQVRNPKTGKYVLVNVTLGRIEKYHPRTNTPYKGIKIISKRKEVEFGNYKSI